MVDTHESLKRQRETASGNSGSDQEQNTSEVAGYRGLSDTHLKHVDDLVGRMKEDQLGRIFIVWREHPAAAKQYPASRFPAAGYGDEETEELNELRGINWGALRDAAGRLDHLSGKRDELMQKVKSLRVDLDQSWQGKAADAALERYRDLLAPVENYCDATRKFSSALKKAAEVPEDSISGGDNIFSAPKSNSTFWASYGESCDAEAIMEDIEGLGELIGDQYRDRVSNMKNRGPFGEAVFMRMAHDAAQRHNLSLEEAEVTDHVGYVDLSWEELKLPGSPGCRTNYLNIDYRGGTPAHKRIQWLDTFCFWYSNDIEFLRKRIHQARQSTLDAWNALASILSELDDDPFGKAKTGGPDQQPPQGKPAGEQAPPPGAGRGATDVPPGGGSVPGTGGGSGAGGGLSSPAGGDSSSASAASRAPSAPAPGDMPVPPEQPQSPGISEAPGSGDAGRSPDAPVAPSSEFGSPSAPGEQVTVGEGTNRVTLREVGPNGEVRLSVPGADGEPRTYEIGFGQEGPTLQQGVSDQVAPGQGGAGQPGIGEPWTAAPGEGQATPQGPAFPVGAEEAVRVPVGPDGQAVIEEADRTITVERVPSGELSLSVDTGEGNPQSYTVDFGGEDSGQQPSAPQTPATDAARVFEAGPVGAATAAVGGAEGFGQASMDAPSVSAPTASQSTGFEAVSGFGAGEGGWNSFGSASGTLFASTDGDGGSQWGRSDGVHQAQSGATGLPSMSGAAGTASPQGATGLASMGGSAAGDGATGSPGAGGGTMPMGGMAGAGQQGGGDQERSNDNPWRTQGNLFGDGIDADGTWQYRAVLGESEDT